MKVPKRRSSEPVWPKKISVLNLRLQWAGEGKGAASLVIETLVDGEPIANFNFVATDLYQLALSAQSGGNYQILNCWCGLPDCVGLGGGTPVQHLNDAVRWMVRMSHKARGHRPAVQRFVFNRAQYNEEIARFVKEIVDDGPAADIVLYTKHRHIQAGGLEKLVGLG
jgi:hypothetical protein